MTTSIRMVIKFSEKKRLNCVKGVSKDYFKIFMAEILIGHGIYFHIFDYQKFPICEWPRFPTKQSVYFDSFTSCSTNNYRLSKENI